MMAYINLFIIGISFYIYFVVLVKKSGRRSIFNEIKSGEVCYRCKEKIEERKLYESYNRRMCDSCKRETSLNKVLGIYKIEPYRLSSSVLSGIHVGLNFISIAFNLIGIIFPIFSSLSSALLLIAAIAFYINYIQTTKKK